LIDEPGVERRNRKLLEINPPGTWELRIGRYRVFYDLDMLTQLVLVKTVDWKERNTLYIRGEEYVL
jgi:mRNA-degrading endonuclease RelE of RelBE toxin-antitoxin system